MNRLARETLLGQFAKIDMETYEYCLAGKTTRKSTIAIDPFWHLWSYEC